MIKKNEVLKDGYVLKVPLLTDSAPRIPAPRIDDNFAPQMQGHRPGFVVVTDQERAQRVERQRALDAKLSGRWRGAPAPKMHYADTREAARARSKEALSNRWKRT